MYILVYSWKNELIVDIHVQNWVFFWSNNTDDWEKLELLWIKSNAFYQSTTNTAGHKLTTESTLANYVHNRDKLLFHFSENKSIYCLFNHIAF